MFECVDLSNNAACTPGVINSNPLNTRKQGHYDRYMFVNAGIVALVGLLFFFWVSKRYQERPILVHDEEVRATAAASMPFAQ